MAKIKNLKFKIKNFGTGFTLIEALVVFSIMAFITVSLLNTVFRSRLNIGEVVRITLSDIRTAQANALAAKQYNGTHRCGYGIHKIDNANYTLYVGIQISDSGNCNVRKFKDNNDTPILITRLLDPRLEFYEPSGKPDFNDIFFDTYNGEIEIDGQPMSSTDPSKNISQIVIRKIGAACPSKNCVYICVYSFGRIAIRTDQACPLCLDSADNTPAACQQWE